MEAIVLAGGLGTRLQREVRDVPKPMAPFESRPFLEHQILYWRAQGVSTFILATGYRGEVIREHFGDSWAGATIRYSHETVPLGTGGAFLQALGLIEGERPFLVLNGDTWLELVLPALLEFHSDRRAAMTFVASEATDGSGATSLVLVAGTSRVRAIKPGAPGPGIVCSGAWLVSPGLCARLRGAGAGTLNWEADVISPLLGSDEFHAFVLPGVFVDFGTPAGYRRAKGILSSRYRRNLTP